MAALPAEGLKVSEIAAATKRSKDCARRLTRQACRKLGVRGQVELVHHVLAVDALPQRREDALALLLSPSPGARRSLHTSQMGGFTMS